MNLLVAYACALGIPLIVPVIWFLAWRRSGRVFSGFFTTLTAMNYLVYIAVIVDMQHLNADLVQGVIIAQIIAAVISIGFGSFLSQHVRTTRQQQVERPSKEESTELINDLENFEQTTLNVYTCTETELSALEEIGPVRARKIQQFIGQGKQFESFDHFADFIGLKEFERPWLRETIDLSPVSRPEKTMKAQPHGRVIDV